MENFYFPKWRFPNVKDVLVQKIYLLHATFPSGRFTLYNLGAIASSQGVSFLSKSKTTLKTSHEELAFVSVLITNYPCADNYIFRMYIKKLMWNTQRWTYLMRATNNVGLHRSRRHLWQQMYVYSWNIDQYNVIKYCQECNIRLKNVKERLSCWQNMTKILAGDRKSVWVY